MDGVLNLRNGLAAPAKTERRVLLSPMPCGVADILVLCFRRDVVTMRRRASVGEERTVYQCKTVRNAVNREQK